MLDGLQPQKLDAGALSVGALARLMREERQRQPDKKIHLVLDGKAAEGATKRHVFVGLDTLERLRGLPARARADPGAVAAERGLRA